MLLGKDKTWWLEWISTVVLIMGVALTAFNIYPANIYVCLVGNLLWLATAFIWNKWSLVIVEFIIVIIYLVGIFNTFLL